MSVITNMNDEWYLEIHMNVCVYLKNKDGFERNGASFLFFSYPGHTEWISKIKNGRHHLTASQQPWI